MPSLFGTDVAANYGRMTAQDTYATGPAFSNFGTRSLRLLKVTVSGGSANDLTTADGSTGSYTASNSPFSKAVRALQTCGEIYLVGVPSSTAFMALVSGDTFNDSDTSSNTPLGYGDLEAAIASAIGSGTVAVTATGTAANPGIFVGAALGTFA